jgi:RimJ/RimL family protein N-acetyltransferase
VGSEVPDALVPALHEAVETAPLAAAPDHEPPAIAACREILATACAPLDLSAGPYYLIESPALTPTGARLVRSDGPSAEHLRPLNPGNWGRHEWDDLLDGTLGPWAMALVDEQIVSIAHTPLRMTDRAAECGVWTHPDHRGRGHAAEVTATWANILQPSARYLFYSTDAHNLSSQRVAARLKLRLIGWIWTLYRARQGQGTAIDLRPMKQQNVARNSVKARVYLHLRACEPAR